jgi:hypothetical protein
MKKILILILLFASSTVFSNSENDFCKLSTANNANARIFLENALNNFVNGENEACEKNYEIEKIFENDKKLDFPTKAKRKYKIEFIEYSSASYFSQFKIHQKPILRKIHGFEVIVYKVDLLYSLMSTQTHSEVLPICERYTSEIWVLKTPRNWYIATPNHIQNNFGFYIKNTLISMKKASERLNSINNPDAKIEKQKMKLSKSYKNIEIYKKKSEECKIKL